MMPSPETPNIKAVGKLKTARPGKPPVGKDFSMASGRAQEAEMFAAAMGQAFGITKMQNKRQKAKARARGRMAEQQPKRQGKQVVRAGRRSGRAARENMYRTALREARIRGIGADIFKRAKL